MTLDLWMRGETEADARAGAEAWATAEPNVIEWAVIAATKHPEFYGVWTVRVRIELRSLAARPADQPTLGLSA